MSKTEEDLIRAVMDEDLTKLPYKELKIKLAGISNAGRAWLRCRGVITLGQYAAFLAINEKDL